MWSTKYTAPVGVVLCSQPGGNSPSSSSMTYSRQSLSCGSPRGVPGAGNAATATAAEAPAVVRAGRTGGAALLPPVLPLVLPPCPGKDDDAIRRITSSGSVPRRDGDGTAAPAPAAPAASRIMPLMLRDILGLPVAPPPPPPPPPPVPRGNCSGTRCRADGVAAAAAAAGTRVADGRFTTLGFDGGLAGSNPNPSSSGSSNPCGSGSGRRARRAPPPPPPPPLPPDPPPPPAVVILVSTDMASMLRRERRS